MSWRDRPKHTDGAGRQSKHGGHSHREMWRRAQRKSREELRDKRGAASLSKQSRSALHATGSAAARQRRCEKHVAVVGNLEEAEADSGRH